MDITFFMRFVSKFIFALEKKQKLPDIKIISFRDSFHNVLLRPKITPSFFWKINKNGPKNLVKNAKHTNSTWYILIEKLQKRPKNIS